MSPILVSGVGIFFTLTAGSVLHWVQLRRRRSERLMNGLPIPTNPRLVFDPSSIVFTWQIRRLLKMVVRIWPILVLLCFVLAVSLLSLAVAKNEQFQNGANYSSENTYLLTPWKRLQSYYDVDLSSDRIIDLPETGTQIRMGRENILEAVCKTPFEELCPMNAASGMAPGAEERLLRLYAVQDDFAAVSLIHTFGIDGAILYMSLQAALIVCAMAIGFVVLTAKLDAKLASWMLGCASIGLASIYGAQVLFAWGNVLGFLPVMGQPMTFVSLGASHHFGVGVPFAAIVMLAASLAEPTAAMRDQWRRNMFAHKAVAL